MRKELAVFLLIPAFIIPSIKVSPVYASSDPDDLWERFLKYDLCITDYNELTDKEQELCRFIFDTEQSSEDTIICERARRILAHDPDIGERIFLEQLDDCYGICDMFSENFYGYEEYIHCVPDIKHLDGTEDYNEYWLDDNGTIKVYSTGENSGIKEKNVFTVDIPSVTDVSAYLETQNLETTELNDGTYHVTFEIERKSPNPRYLNIPIQTVDDGNTYYDFTDLDGKDGMIVYNGDLYRITENKQAIFVMSKYSVFYVADFDTAPVTDKVVIPSEVNGYPVVSIGRQAFLKSFITRIELPDSLVRIDPMAFTECRYLTEINFPESLSYIGAYAFLGSGVTELEIEAKRLIISKEAFRNCKKLVSVHINAKSIGEKAFDYCESLKEVSIGGDTEIICADSFLDCNSLEIVKLSESVRRIGTGAFNNRISEKTGSKSIIIPSTVEVIGALPKQHGILTSGFDVRANHPLTDEPVCAFNNDCVIKGYKGTEAERYAKEWDLEFVSLEAETGDVNLDGEINISDAVALQRFLLGKYVSTGAYYGDMNEDSSVDVFDLVILKKILLDAGLSN